MISLQNNLQKDTKKKKNPPLISQVDNNMTTQWQKVTKKITTRYNTQYRKIKTNQREALTKTSGVLMCTGRVSKTAPRVTSCMLLLLVQTRKQV